MELKKQTIEIVIAPGLTTYNLTQLPFADPLRIQTVVAITLIHCVYSSVNEAPTNNIDVVTWDGINVALTTLSSFQPPTSASWPRIRFIPRDGWDIRRAVFGTNRLISGGSRGGTTVATGLVFLVLEVEGY